MSNNKMINIILENWLSLISLSIALIGGVPGLITVLNNKKARPNLGACPLAAMTHKGSH
jgi:hypothetical protein